MKILPKGRAILLELENALRDFDLSQAQEGTKEQVTALLCSLEKIRNTKDKLLIPSVIKNVKFYNEQLEQLIQGETAVISSNYFNFNWAYEIPIFDKIGFAVCQRTVDYLERLLTDLDNCFEVKTDDNGNIILMTFKPSVSALQILELIHRSALSSMREYARYREIEYDELGRVRLDSRPLIYIRMNLVPDDAEKLMLTLYEKANFLFCGIDYSNSYWSQIKVPYGMRLAAKAINKEIVRLHSIKKVGDEFLSNEEDKAYNFISDKLESIRSKMNGHIEDCNAYVRGKHNKKKKMILQKLALDLDSNVKRLPTNTLFSYCFNEDYFTLYKTYREIKSKQKAQVHVSHDALDNLRNIACCYLQTIKQNIGVYHDEIDSLITKINKTQMQDGDHFTDDLLSTIKAEKSTSPFSALFNFIHHIIASPVDSIFASLRQTQKARIEHESLCMLNHLKMSEAGDILFKIIRELRQGLSSLRLPDDPTRFIFLKREFIKAEASTENMSLAHLIQIPKASAQASQEKQHDSPSHQLAFT